MRKLKSGLDNKAYCTHSAVEDCAGSVIRYGWIISALHIIKYYTGKSQVSRGTRSAKDKLERHSQKRSARNGTHLGRGGGGSSQQTRMASECGPIRSRGRGMNQVK